MSQRTFFGVVGAICVLFGLGFAIDPNTAGSLFGPRAHGIGSLAGRSFGIAIFWVGMIYLPARDLGPSSARTGMLWAGMVSSIALAVLFVVEILNGVLYAATWSMVALGILFALGFLSLIAAERKTAAWSKVASSPSS